MATNRACAAGKKAKILWEGSLDVTEINIDCHLISFWEFTEFFPSLGSRELAWSELTLMGSAKLSTTTKEVIWGIRRVSKSTLNNPGGLWSTFRTRNISFASKVKELKCLRATEVKSTIWSEPRLVHSWLYHSIWSLLSLLLSWRVPWCSVLTLNRTPFCVNID